MEENAQDNWWAESKGNLMDYKSLSLPGSTVTGFVSMASLGLLTFFLCILIYGIWMRMELNGFFRDVGPIALISAAIWYLCFSFRIVISRNQDSVIIHRQFLAPQIQYLRREYPVHSLTADQVTNSSGEDGNSTTSTTLYSGEEVIVRYIGHKRKLKHVLPELLD
jgi:hypothetical protein